MRNPLNDSDVDGNTMAYMMDSDRTRKDDGDAPSIVCPYCGEPVEEYEYIDEMKMCKQCYEEEFGGSFVSPDQIEKDR